MRWAAILFAGVLAFFAGIVCYDVRNPSVAEASGVGSAAVNLSAYSGNAGISGNLAVTGTLGVTGAATLRGGLTEIGSVAISGNVGITGSISATGSGSNHGVAGRGGSGNWGILGYGTGAGGGVWAENLAGSGGGGYALLVNGDPTSPVKAPIHVEPQDAQPTGSHVVGDMYVTTTGILKICTVAGTPGTWHTVGDQTGTTP